MSTFKKITVTDIKEFLFINFGLFLMAVGIYFFKFPNNFTTGGVTGITVVLNSFLPGISASTIMLIINVLFLIFGFIFLNKDFGVKTVYLSLIHI